jgi:glucokinase
MVRATPRDLVEEPLVLAVDLGGTRMRAALVDPDGAIVHRHEQPTPRDVPCPDALDGLVGHVRGHGDPARAVVGVPGLVDYERGRLEHAPNLPPGWADAISASHFAATLGLPVALVNDADLAALGEARFGAGRDARDVVYMTVSTGVGAGVVLDGHLVHGRHSGAEIGHTILDLSAHRDGRPATVEQLGSGTALARAAGDAGLPLDGAAVVERVRAGDPVATAVWDDVVAAVAAAAANLAHLFTPQVIVLGGGVSEAGDLLVGPLRAFVAQHGPPLRSDAIAVVTADLGDDAGLVGAAAWPATSPDVAASGG